MRGNLMKLMEQRADLYRLLARLYVLEVDKELLVSMKNMTFPADVSDVDLKDGYALLSAYLDGVNLLDEGSIAAAITELEVEYARIFLAAGVAQGRVAFPYESVYTSKKHLLVQESCDDMTMLYAAKGLKARPDMYRIPDDHAGLEFEYMQRLCQRAATALATDDEADFEATCKEQKDFFEAHLKGWVSLFGEDIRKHAQTDFFRGVGRITRGFMSAESALLG